MVTWLDAEVGISNVSTIEQLQARLQEAETYSLDAHSIKAFRTIFGNVYAKDSLLNRMSSSEFTKLRNAASNIERTENRIRTEEQRKLQETTDLRELQRREQEVREREDITKDSQREILGSLKEQTREAKIINRERQEVERTLGDLSSELTEVRTLGQRNPSKWATGEQRKIQKEISSLESILRG